MRGSAIFAMVLLLGASACAGQTPQSDETNASAAAGDTASGPPPGPPPPLDFPPLEIGTAPEHDYTDAQIARGAELVLFGGCNDCHTPWNMDPEIGIPVPDMSRMLSGHPRGAPDPQGTLGPRDMVLIGPTNTSFAFPFGVVYAMNLTPDMSTGTGSWTEQMFVDAFRNVKHMGGDGRTILPPMPWPSMASLSDADMVSIFAFMRSIPPIVNAVPPAQVPEPVIEAIGRANQALLERMRAQQR